MRGGLHTFAHQFRSGTAPRLRKIRTENCQSVSIATHLRRAGLIRARLDFDGADIRVRGASDAVHRHATRDKSIIIAADDLVVDHGRVVNLGYFTMLDAKMSGGMVVEVS